MQPDDLPVKRITQFIAAFWILMKAISLKLWIKERNYPLVPIVDMPSFIHYTLLLVFFALAAWLIYKPDSRYVMIAILLTEAIDMLGDQTRLQPWHYQFWFTFLAIAGNYPNKAKALQAIVFVTISTYFFSGLQKINSGFIDTVWSFHILKRFFNLPNYVIRHRPVQLAGYVTPLIEIGGALCLLLRKHIMKLGASLLIGMHIFLLIFLGPLGLNYNVVVWPWNVQMAIFLYLLFIKNNIRFKPLVYNSYTNLVVALFWGLMPIVGMFGNWDKFLSSGMYSGKGKLWQYHFNDSTKIPAELKSYAFYSKTDSSARIVLTDWTIQELNVASVTEPRLLTSITRQLNERYKNQGVNFELTDHKY